MKTITLKPLVVTIALFVFMLQGFSQITGTKIDVQGAYYSDQMWVFSVPTCTRYFDNGWDGYKMLGTTSAPQIYAIEPDGNYQVDAIPNFNNTVIGFIAGTDVTYTMTFTNQYFSPTYTNLYLIDSVANKKIDIYTSGTKYTFTATNRTPVKRFKLVTEAVVIPPVIPPVVTPPPPSPTLTVSYVNKIITVVNTGTKGTLNVVDATTSKIKQTFSFNANATTTLQPKLTAGTVYILNAFNTTNKVSLKIIASK